MSWKLIHTDNFGRDYPDERVVEQLPGHMPKEMLQQIANICNEYVGPNSSRYWKVVPEDYKLQPGFEP